MKHKQKGLLELVIDGKIEKAIHDYGSAEWASLPYENDKSRHEYKGKLQPATPLQKCLTNYNKFLKQELTGSTDLHLKKGFLKEFGYSCCESKESVTNSTGCGEKLM